MSRFKRFAELYTNIDVSGWENEMSDKDRDRWRLEFAIANDLEIPKDIINKE
jgi:hypothetical protein